MFPHSTKIVLLVMLFQLVTASSDHDRVALYVNESRKMSSKVGPLAKSYFGVTQFMSFIEFLEYCHQNGMQPAEVNSQQENNAMIQYLDTFPAPKYFWLGGTDIGREGRYYWIASLQEFNYSSWGQGYPNGGTQENCATVYGGDGTWFDQYCSNDQIWPLCQTVTR